MRAFARRHWPVVLPLLLSAFVFRAWLDPTTLIASADFPPFPGDVIRGGALGWPHMWTALYFGLSQTFWASQMKLFALSSPLFALGAPFPVVERFLWLWPYMFGAPLLGYYLCYRFTRNTYGAALGAMLFSVNTWNIGIVERGHIPSLDAYMFAGIVLPLSFDFARRPSRRLASALALLVSVQIAYDLRYAYESLLVLALLVLLELPRLVRRGRVRALATGALVLGAGLFVLNLDFVLPALVTTPPAGWGTVEALKAASHFGSLFAAFSLFYPFYHFMIGTSGFIESPPELPFALVAAAAWAGLIVTRRRPTSRALFVLAVLAVAILSETAGPFGWLDIALYQHVPGFSMFRDLTKFNGVLAPVYAIGLALAIVALLGFLRLRLPVRFPQTGAVVAVATALLYAFVARDTLNPLRQSDLAAAAPFSASGAATEKFLRANLGDARFVMLPGDMRWQRRESILPDADATFMAATPPPGGFSLLNPGISQSDALFELFASPLAPGLLGELRVKYVVVPDDRILYYLFDGRPQRQAAIDFLRQRSWLHEVARFGDEVIFALNAPLVERAFFAPYPTEVLGSPAALEGLAGSPLWSDRAATLIFAQMPPGAAWVSQVPNVVEAPTLLDPQFPLGPAGGATQRLSDAFAAETYRRRPFEGDVFSSAMLTQSYLSWNLDSEFSYHFTSSANEPARVSFLMQRRKALPSVLSRDSGDVRSIQSGAAGIVAGSPIVCSHGPVWIQRFNSDTTEQPLLVAAGDSGKEVFVTNPCPVAYRGDVHFQLTSGDLAPASISVTFGSVTQHLTIEPVWLRAFGANVIVKDVVLQPGLNLFQFDKPSPRPFSIGDAYSVSNLTALGSSFAPLPLALSVTHSPSGTLVYATIDVPRSGMHVGYLDLFGALHLPVDEHPVCTLKYTFANVAGSFDLVLNLRRRDTGEPLTLWVPMENRQDAEYDLYGVVRDVLQKNFDNELSFHLSDPVWTAQHFQQGAPSPDDFELDGVRIAATWSLLQSSEVPRSAFVALLRGARLATTARTLGTRWAFPQTHRISPGVISDKNFSLRGFKLLRLDKAEGIESRINAQLIGFTPTGYRLATSLHVGDFVQLALQSGRSAQGTIVAESADYVLLQDGDEPPQRIARGSISTVSKQTITRSAKLDIPIVTTFEPTELLFDTRNDESLKTTVALTYEGADGSRETIPAVDRETTDESGADVEKEFVKPGLLAATTVFDLGVPIDLSLAKAPLESVNSYDLDLWNIERFRFGPAPHRLVGVTLEFTQTPGTDAGDRQVSIGVSNLRISRDRLLSIDVGGAAVGQTLLTLDGSQISVKRTSVLADSNDYFTGAASLGTLPLGNHVVQSQPLDDVYVRSAIVARGTPTHFYSGRVNIINDVTPSESTGSLSGAGLMIVPRTFDNGWSLALWPPGARAPRPTGFALFDWLRTAGHAVPAVDHVPVNTYVDGWYVAPGVSGDREFTLIFVPEALNELGFFVTLLAVLAVCVRLKVWRRWAAWR